MLVYQRVFILSALRKKKPKLSASPQIRQELTPGRHISHGSTWINTRPCPPVRNIFSKSWLGCYAGTSMVVLTCIDPAVFHGAVHHDFPQWILPVCPMVYPMFKDKARGWAIPNHDRRPMGTMGTMSHIVDVFLGFVWTVRIVDCGILADTLWWTNIAIENGHL